MSRLLNLNRVATAIALLSLVVSTTAARCAEAESARQLVDASGVTGGLIVHVGSADAKTIASLRINDRFVVQALAKDPDRISQARRDLLRLELSGAVTVMHWSGGRLPYADSLVSLLIVDDPDGPSQAELTRALAPGGIAYVKHNGDWQKQEKPWPDDIDEWTHFLHSSDNNAVADDTQVAPPNHLRWVAGPRWGRSHDHLASMSAAVTAAGRIFYIVDEGPIASVAEPSRWMLVARDAFNGVLLWKKELARWEDQLRTFRSGPAELPRRLVAVGDRVYVTLGYGEPVVALDAATGEVVRGYEGTDNTHEIVCHQGKLYLVVCEPLLDDSGTTGRVVRELPPWRDFYRQQVTSYPAKHIRCMDAETGTLVWKKDDAETENVLPITLAVADSRVFFENKENIVALSSDSGDVLWRAARPVSLHRYAWSSPTLVVKDGVVLSADRAADAELDTGADDKSELRWLITSDHLLSEGEIIAYDARSGRKLWTAPCHDGFNFPVDVLVVDGRVFSGVLAWKPQPGVTQVFDLHSGEVVDTRPPDQECYSIGFGHARCYRNKATTNYLLHGRSGVEFLDVNSHTVVADHWIRGTCQYGILPANGLTYVPPHSCACYIDAKLNNFNALAAEKKEEEKGSGGEGESGTTRLQRGSAYNTLIPNPSSLIPSPSDWPTYRCDASRSGVAGVALSSNLAPGWEKSFEGPITGPVIADGRLYFAQSEAHTVHALDAADGSPLWHFAAGSRVDSPPTVHAGRVYFGSADGWIYCLTATDGKLVWRFRAAPAEKQVVSYSRMESAWPVHGNVLVHQEGSAPASVYAVAGRSSFVDGGIFFCRLDAQTGRLIAQKRISHRDPETGREPQDTVIGVIMPGALPDVLATDGSSLFMRQACFDMQGNPLAEPVEHLFSPAGFLDDTWWHRTYWQVGTTMLGGYGGWAQVGNVRISGRLLVTAGDRVFGFGRKEYGATGAHLGIQATYHLFAADADLIYPEPPPAGTKPARKPRLPQTAVDYLWSNELPFYPRAMLLSGETIFVAGPSQVPDLAAEKPQGDIWLQAVSATDGARLSRYKLKSPPVFDSLAAAAGNLYFTTLDGRVVCYQRSE